MIITVDDIRRFHCSRGLRRWFEAQGLDFRAFLDHGIEAEVLLATGDARAEKVVAAKREEVMNGRR